MSRIPPSLLYLTIYNPSLRPIGFVSPDDEDAEEQAHILFYTSRDRAVSRDRMLRQVGLAKALVNFSEMFGTTEPCDNIHSQSKRMVMLSPEHNFWMHAAVELAKTPRPVLEKTKGKGKADAPLVYDHIDGSVHDPAIRAYLERGYEIFKLTHGSLTSILSTLGQEALELQLERFFTSWAWTWDFENGPELGVPLYPLYKLLMPLLDDFASKLPNEIFPIVVSSPYFIPSTKFTNARYPSSLCRHLLSLTPPSRPSAIRQGTDKTIDVSLNAVDAVGKERPTSECLAPTSLSQSQPSGSSAGASGPNFLGTPAVSMNASNMNLNVNINMDVRKWSWPGVLTFGRNHGKKIPGQLKDEEDPEPKRHENGKESPKARGNTDATQLQVKVDTSSLEDAMASDARSVAAASVETSALAESLPTANSDVAGEFHAIAENSELATDLPSSDTTLSLTDGNFSLGSSVSSDHKHEPPLPSQVSLPVPTPEFLSTMVHLPVGDDSTVTMTRWRKVLYIGNHNMIVALVEGLGDENRVRDASLVAARCLKLLEDIQTVVEDASEAICASLPSATKILQPKDKHMISSKHFTDSSPDFFPKSEQLYDGKRLLDKDSDISEVFSRGQNPQHWYVTRRGLGVGDSGEKVEGDVFLEISRKEASLTDVDNVLVSVVKRFN